MGSGPGGQCGLPTSKIRYSLGSQAIRAFTPIPFSVTPRIIPGPRSARRVFAPSSNGRIFDWMTVDSNRNMAMITTYDWNHGTEMNMKEVRRMNSGLYRGQVEHKYDYSANQFNVRAWGWVSSANTRRPLVRQSVRRIP